MVATLNMTLFFVLRSAFTPPVSCPSPTFTVPPELMRELTATREAVIINAKDGRNGTENSTCKEQSTSTVKKDNSVVSKCTDLRRYFSCGQILLHIQI